MVSPRRKASTRWEWIRVNLSRKRYSSTFPWSAKPQIRLCSRSVRRMSDTRYLMPLPSPTSPSCLSILLLLRRCLILSRQRVPLRLDTLLSPLASSLGLCTFGIHFLLQGSFTRSFGLGFVDLKRRNIRSAMLLYITK